MSRTQQIVPGVTVTPAGQATVEPSLTGVFCDLAIQLEESTDLPVDVEHVLAAVVLASQEGKLDPNAALKPDDSKLIEILKVHVKTIFADYGGIVEKEDLDA